MLARALLIVWAVILTIVGRDEESLLGGPRIFFVRGNLFTRVLLESPRFFLRAWLNVPVFSIDFSTKYLDESSAIFNATCNIRFADSIGNFQTSRQYSENYVEMLAACRGNERVTN